MGSKTRDLRQHTQTIHMEVSDTFNTTDGALIMDEVQPYVAPSFSAWIPAVLVAVCMLAFLTASFFLRHRKVKKKRELLMDYFYIIFQYGGMRRKRMVAALCNTNDIKLRELGRSFMISFDSIANSDNSCPFYLEDTAFTNAQPQMSTPVPPKKNLLKPRGGGGTSRKIKASFRRYNTGTSSEENTNPVSFNDIIMRFKSKRPNNGQSGFSTPRRAGSHLEGSSMSTIHGDNFDYQSYMEEQEMAYHYNRRRRNAYVMQYDASTPKFAEVVSEIGRQSLGSFHAERLRPHHSPVPVKRNSEPSEGDNTGQISKLGQSSGVFHVPGADRLSPANVVCGSHGYIPQNYEPCGTFPTYRNSEPTILIHSASTDTDSSQGWSDIRTRHANGIVFLKRVPKGDDAPGEYFYEEQPQSTDIARRASLSKVSYVPSGNMNEYYNCFNSSRKHNPSESSSATEEQGRSPNSTVGPSKHKKSRLSLGEIAVSNFNRRIDIASDSLPEYEWEDGKTSQEHSSDQQRPKTTWMRFKNVFTGSRAAQSFNRSHSKASKTMSAGADRYTKRNRQQHTRWQRFVNVFTGFRSLPEAKKHEVSVDIPQLSSSYPLGLDVRSASCHNMLDTDELQSRAIDSDRHPHSSRFVDPSMPGSAVADQGGNNENRAKERRPTTLYVQSKTHSFPEDLSHGRQHYQRFKTVFGASRMLQNDPNRFQRSGGRRYRKRGDTRAVSSLSLPRTEEYYKYAAAQVHSEDEDRVRKYSYIHEEKPRASTPSRLEGISGTDVPLYLTSPDNNGHPHVRALSPRGPDVQALKPSVDADTISNKSVYLTPMETTPHGSSPNFLTQEAINNTEPTNVFSPTTSHNESSEHWITSPPNGEGYVRVACDDVREEPDGEGSCPASARKATPETRRQANMQNSSRANSDSNEKVPEISGLIQEHRIVGRSDESVYHDTSSTPISPSPFYKEDPSNTFRPPSRSTSDNQRSGCNTPTAPGISYMRSEVLPSPSHTPQDRLSPVPRDRLSPVPNRNGSPRPSRYNKEPAYRAEQRPNSPRDANIRNQYNVSPSDSHMGLAPQASVWQAVRNMAEHINTNTSKHPLPYSDNHYISALSAGRTDQGLADNKYPVRKTSVHACNSDSVIIAYDQNSPYSSRPTTPARAESSPVPSERSVSRESGIILAEDYMANVVRLPRLIRRQSQGSPFYGETSGVCKDNNDDSKQESCPDQATATTTSRTTPAATAAMTEGASHVQISPYDTLI